MSHVERYINFYSNQLDEEMNPEDFKMFLYRTVQAAHSVWYIVVPNITARIENPHFSGSLRYNSDGGKDKKGEFIATTNEDGKTDILVFNMSEIGTEPDGSTPYKTTSSYHGEERAPVPLSCTLTAREASIYRNILFENVTKYRTPLSSEPIQ